MPSENDFIFCLHTLPFTENAGYINERMARPPLDMRSACRAGSALRQLSPHNPLAEGDEPDIRWNLGFQRCRWAHVSSPMYLGALSSLVSSGGSRFHSGASSRQTALAMLPGNPPGLAQVQCPSRVDHSVWRQELPDRSGQDGG